MPIAPSENLRLLQPCLGKALLQIGDSEKDAKRPLSKLVRNQSRQPHLCRQSSGPEPVRRAPNQSPKPALSLERSRHQPLCKDLSRHGGIVLAKHQAPLEVIVDGPVQRRGRQRAVAVAGDLRLDGAGHGNHDADIKGLQLEAQDARPAVDGGLGRGVDGAEDVGADGAGGGDVDDETARGDELLGKGLDGEHGAEDVCLVGLADVVDFNVEGGDGVSAAAVSVS